MTQMLIQELQITSTTLGAVLKRACKKWNKEHPHPVGPATVHDFLVNILYYWDTVTHTEWKENELAETIAELLRDGTPGYVNLTEDQLMAKVLTEGVVGDAIEDGKSLHQLLVEHPWITWEDD